MTPSKQSIYARRFARVLDYIDRHLHEPLPIEKLGRVAHFSSYHFLRQFTHYVGITPSRYVQLVRLRKASYRLAFNPLESITAIAMEAGFENAESFSRAFRKTFGQSPSGFRRAPDWAAWSAQFKPIHSGDIGAMQVRIVNVKPTTVATLEHRGDPARLPDSVQRFIAWRRETGLSPVASSNTYGVPYDDPAAVAPENFRFDICGVVTDPVPKNAYGIITKLIPGGRCAVARHSGSTDQIATTVYYLYRNWLPQSGEVPRDFPVYFHYLDVGMETPDDQRQTDVYLPIR